MSTTDAAASPLPAEMSDRFGPMLVKELRQGLRTKVFLTAFIGFQVILLIMVLSSFASLGSRGDSGTFLNSAIWGILMLMLVVVTPLRGLFAIEKELRAGTLELLQITRLDAWKIVRGKWGALMGEAMLYLTASLPYFTLRYFLGGVQILSDLGLLALLALFSASITAVVVGLSGFRSTLLRIGVALGIVMIIQSTIGYSFVLTSPYVSGPFSGLSSRESWLLLLGFVIALIIVGWSFLRLGARTIATQAENHSSGARILTLAGLAIVIPLDRLAGSSSLASDSAEFLFFLIALSIFICGIFSAITDNVLQSSLIYSPFIRRHLTAVGRVLLYPGWGSGFFYVVLMSVPLLLLRFVSASANELIPLIVILIILNFFLQPAAITRMLMRNRGSNHFNLSTYITMLVGCAIASSVLVMAEAIVTEGDPELTRIFPVPALFGLDSNDREGTVALQFVGLILCCVVLVPLAVTDIAYTRNKEIKAREILAKRKLEATRAEPATALVTVPEPPDSASHRHPDP